jgi:hypothetical protein
LITQNSFIKTISLYAQTGSEKKLLGRMYRIQWYRHTWVGEETVRGSSPPSMLNMVIGQIVRYDGIARSDFNTPP